MTSNIVYKTHFQELQYKPNPWTLNELRVIVVPIYGAGRAEQIDGEVFVSSYLAAYTTRTYSPPITQRLGCNVHYAKR